MVKDTHAWAQVTTTFSHPGFGDALATMMFMLTPAVRSRLLSRACNRLLGIKVACQYIAVHPHEATQNRHITHQSKPGMRGSKTDRSWVNEPYGNCVGKESRECRTAFEKEWYTAVAWWYCYPPCAIFIIPVCKAWTLIGNKKKTIIAAVTPQPHSNEYIPEYSPTFRAIIQSEFDFVQFRSPKYGLVWNSCGFFVETAICHFRDAAFHLQSRFDARYFL